MTISWKTFIAGGMTGMALHIWATGPGNVEQVEKHAKDAVASGRTKAERNALRAEEKIRKTTQLRLEMLDNKAAEIRQRVEQEGEEQLKRAQETIEESAEEAFDDVEERTSKGFINVKKGTRYAPATDTVIHIPEALTKKTIVDLRGMTSNSTIAEGEEE